MFVFEPKYYILKIFVWNLGEKAKNMGNQGGDVENHGGSLGIAVETKYESNGKINSNCGEK